MKILVCIKQVPDMESKFKVNAAGNWYEETDLAWRMNEYDEYAVEQAVQLKQQVGEADLTVLCIGSDRVKETMKKPWPWDVIAAPILLMTQATLKIRLQLLPDFHIRQGQRF